MFYFIGSDLEKQEIKQAYITGKGDMDYIVDHVQFARSEQEPRIRDILNVRFMFLTILSMKLYISKLMKLMDC